MLWTTEVEAKAQLPPAPTEGASDLSMVHDKNMNTPTIRSYELLHACGSHTHAYHEMLMVKAHLSLSGLLVFSGVIFAT